MTCSWCMDEIKATARCDSRFCSKLCRQTAFRLRRRAQLLGDPSLSDRGETDRSLDVIGDVSPVDPRATRPLRFAYADPPFPGMARKFYGDRPEYAGEVDHEKLIGSLSSGAYSGWALSTSARALRDLLPLCPREARVCAWVKPHGVSTSTYGLHNVWEAVIVLQGRRLRPGRPDALVALPARGGRKILTEEGIEAPLPGRKPVAFCAWLFAALGMLPGDELVDLFPGTGIVGDAWRELSRVHGEEPSVGAGATQHKSDYRTEA